MNNLKYLAEQLAINYYNASVVPDNSQVLEDKDSLPDKDKIFSSTKENDNLYFSRNIVIIGAGASKSAYKFSLTANELINKVFVDGEIGEFLQKQSNWEKFLNEFNKVHNVHLTQRKIYDPEYLKEQLDKLTFEQAMGMFCSLLGNNRINEIIKNAIDEFGINKFIPCFLYEALAHLFNHRYIDVIVNMNFDEALDNSIEDEMGASTYYKIIEEEDVIPINLMMDDKRLRVPIYIKPHGVIKKANTYKYTTESYIQNSERVIELAKQLFNGDVGNSRGKIKKSNIIFLGYSLGDIDILNLLFEQFKETLNDRKIEYFIFDLKPESVKVELVKKFDDWITKSGGVDTATKEKLKNDFKRTVENSYCFECASSNYNEPENLTSNELSGYLAKLYKLIQGEFKNPFKPRDLSRHELLTKFFPRNKLAEELYYISLKPEMFFLKRAKFHCLYDFIKFKGKVPIEVLTKDRAGIYYGLYLRTLSEKGHDNLMGRQNLIGFLNRITNDKSDFALNHSYIYCQKFYDGDEEDRYINISINKMIEVSYPSFQEAEEDDFKKEIKKTLKEKVLNKKANEINPVYLDKEHARFYPFRFENIIDTNLELTWKFYHFAIKRIRDWKTLIIVDENAKPLYNFYKYPSLNCLDSVINEPSKKIILIHSVLPSEFNGKDIDEKTPVNTIKILKKCFGKGKNKATLITRREFDERKVHKMALFIGYDDIPKFGIYYLQLGSKVRINPVYFSFDDSYNHIKVSEENLNMLYEICKYNGYLE